MVKTFMVVGERKIPPSYQRARGVAAASEGKKVCLPSTNKTINAVMVQPRRSGIDWEGSKWQHGC